MKNENKIIIIWVISYIILMFLISEENYKFALYLLGSIAYVEFARINIDRYKRQTNKDKK